MYEGVELELHAFLTLTVAGVISFTPRPLNTAGKLSLDPLDRKLGGTQEGGSERYVEESNLFSPVRDRTLILFVNKLLAIPTLPTNTFCVEVP
jgi:hypothetical protein